MSNIISPFLQLFEEPMIDDSITDFEYVEYVTRDADVNKDGQRIIETQDLDQYMLPHMAALEIRGRLQKNDNSNYNVGDQITLVNNGWCLFQSAQYQINNQIIEDINLYLPQASTMMNLVMFSDDYARSTSTGMMWYRDTGAGAADLDEFVATSHMLPAAQVGDAIDLKGANFRQHFKIKRNVAYNAGFATRQAITTGDKSVSILLPLSSIFGFCRDITTVMRGVKHTLVLNRQTPNDYILKADGVDDGKFNISTLSLWIPRVTPSLSIQADLESKMVAGFIKQLYFEQLRIYRSTAYLAAQIDCSWRITTNQGSELPRHIFIALQSVTRSNDQKQNNMVFENLDMRRLCVRINTKQYPDRELMTDFRPTSRNYTRAYMMLLDAVHKYRDTDTGTQLSAEDFASLYPIFHIDVSRHSDRLKDAPADLELKWQLGSAPGHAYYVYVLVTSDRFLTLNVINGKMNIIV